MSFVGYRKSDIRNPAVFSSNCYFRRMLPLPPLPTLSSKRLGKNANENNHIFILSHHHIDRDIKAPIIIQVSQGGSAYVAGKGLANDKQQASILGAVSAAHHVRTMAKAYGV